MYKIQRNGQVVDEIWRFDASDVIYSKPAVDSKGNICEYFFVGAQFASFYVSFACKTLLPPHQIHADLQTSARLGASLGRNPTSMQSLRMASRSGPTMAASGSWGPLPSRPRCTSRLTCCTLGAATGLYSASPSTRANRREQMDGHTRLVCNSGCTFAMKPSFKPSPCATRSERHLHFFINCAGGAVYTKPALSPLGFPIFGSDDK